MTSKCTCFYKTTDFFFLQINFFKTCTRNIFGIMKNKLGKIDILIFCNKTDITVCR